MFRSGVAEVSFLMLSLHWVIGPRSFQLCLVESGNPYPVTCLFIQKEWKTEEEIITTIFALPRSERLLLASSCPFICPRGTIWPSAKGFS